MPCWRELFSYNVSVLFLQDRLNHWIVNGLQEFWRPGEPTGDGIFRAFIHGMTNNQDCRRLFELVANESDPRKLSRLLDCLIRALDDRRQALRVINPGHQSSGSGETEN
jgi:hypothetical protein